MSLFCSRWFWLFVSALVLLGFSGCASTQDSDNASVRPWNAPMGWENGLPSTMQQGR
jgi:hypothetical protein